MNAATTTLATNVSVQSNKQRQQQQQDEEERHSLNHNNNFIVTTTVFTPISKTTLNATTTILSSSPSLSLNREKKKTSFSKQADRISQSKSSSYTFTSLSELLHVLSCKNSDTTCTTTTTSNTAFAQRLKQQEEDAAKHQEHILQSALKTVATTPEPTTILATTTRERQHSLWQPVFGSVVGIIFASAILSQPSGVIWSEILQTATQVLAVHGIYRLLVFGIVAVVGQQQQQQYYYGPWMKKAALLVFQLVYTSFFQIPSLLQTHSQYDVSQSLLTFARPRRLVSEFWQNSFGAATTTTITTISSSAAAVFVARTLRRMVVAEVWGRFWKGTWMNQVLSSIRYNTNTFFSTPTTHNNDDDDDDDDNDDDDENNKASSFSKLQKGAGRIQERIPRDGCWLHQMQDFLRDAIRRGSGKLMQHLVQKHVMEVASTWVQDAVVPFLQQGVQSVASALISLFGSTYRGI
jgi:hypothetical protein